MVPRGSNVVELHASQETRLNALARTPIAGLRRLLDWWMRWRRQWFRVDRLIVVEAAAQRERSSQKGER